MFESIIYTTDTAVSAGTSMLIILSALVLGLAIAFCYIFTQEKGSFTKDFVIAIALIPIVVAVIIMLVGNSVARAFSLAGAFALVRFRSAPGSAKDIAVVFLTVAMGLACGLGYIFFGAAATVIVCAVLVVLSKTRFGEAREAQKQLKITIPEDLNYTGVFDDIFKEYSNGCELVSVRTTNMGTMYELTYHISLKAGADEKGLIDSVRCRNGNLNITLGILPNRSSFIM
ncbi:MAG: DUF4956 domain-containing protein [Butyrivibrio sp.]|nr:DUF4956 domain-containing protein [Butyrivibrio sp.]